jgi:hypothetical protein
VGVWALPEWYGRQTDLFKDLIELLCNRNWDLNLQPAVVNQGEDWGEHTSIPLFGFRTEAE